MTISTTSNTTIAQGNGLTTSFDFPFPVPLASELFVSYTNSAGAVTLLTPSQYTTTGVGTGNGGSVTYPISGTPIVTGTSLTIQRIVPYQQLTDLVNQSGYYPNVVENALDYLTMQTQQLAEEVSLSLQVPLANPAPNLTFPSAAARANQVAGFDVNGNATTYPITASIGAGNMTAELGSNGRPGFKTGADFTVGQPSVLTLSQPYGTVGNVFTAWDGVYQERDSYIIAGNQIKYGAWVSGSFVIGTWPDGVNNVDVIGGTTLSLYVPPAGSVGATQMAPNAITDISVSATAAINSSKLSYLRAMSGAIIQTVFAKISNRLDASDFGILATNSDTVNAAAINAALANMGPGVLIFPAGVFNTTGAHPLAQGQYIAAAGKNATQIFNTSLINDTFVLAHSFSGVKDVTLTGTGSRSAGTAINALGAPSHTYISRVSIFNFGTAGIAMNGVVQYIHDIDISVPTTTTAVGILISGGNDQYISGISADGGAAPKCFAGLMITQSGGVWCSDSDFIHFQEGVLLEAVNTVSQFMFFHNVAADTSSDNGWLVTTSGTGKINDCGWSQCWGASATNTGFLFQGPAGSINGLALANTRAIANGTDGIYLQSGVINVELVGGIVSGNSLSPTLTASGIHIGPNLTDIGINGMRVGPSGSASDTQLTQILVDAGTGNRLSIAGCNLQTANTPLNMQGSGGNNTIGTCVGILLKGQVSTTTDVNGHVVVAHNIGTAMKSIQATVQNGTTQINAQPTGASTTTNFALVFLSGGVPLTNTAVTFNWSADF